MIFLVLNSVHHIGMFKVAMTMSFFDAIPSPTKLGIWFLSIFNENPFQTLLSNTFINDLLSPVQWTRANHESSSPEGCVHSPHNRGCWKDGFSIHTDYEVEVPPGKLVEVGKSVSCCSSKIKTGIN